jgi:Tfp pilus assembly protein FimT
MFRTKTGTATLVSRKQGQTGYTVIEIAVVILIIALIAAATLPQALAYMRQYRLTIAGRNIATALQRARYLATSSNSRAGVHIPERDKVQIEQYNQQGLVEPEIKGTIQLTHEITIASDAPRRIAFDGRGIITPLPKESQTIRLNGAKGYYVIVTVSPTGQVQVSEARQDGGA